jgi:hypothetical protein
MIAQMIGYHAMTVYLYIFVLLASLAIPLAWIEKPFKLIRGSRIAALVNYTLLTMIAFDGLVVMVLSSRGWSINMILMVVALVVLIAGEILKGYKFKRFVLSEAKDFKAYQGRYMAIVVAQLLIILPFIFIYN